MADDSKPFPHVLSHEDLFGGEPVANSSRRRQTIRRPVTESKRHVLRFGMLQFAPQQRTEVENLEFILDALKTVTDAVVVLPEFFLSSYRDLPLVFRTIDEFRAFLVPLTKLSRRRGLSLVGSLPVASDRGGAHNQAVLIRDGVLSPIYNKVKLFESEIAYFQVGETGPDVLDFDGVKCNVQICLDIYDPSPSQRAAQQGAQFILSPSTVSVDFLHHIHKARALETQSVSIMCNRTGVEEDGTRYLGCSGFFFPDGTERRMTSDEEGLALMDLRRSQLDRMTATRRSLP